MSDRLKAAEQQAKDLANAKSPNKPDPPSNVIGVGSSAGGQVKKDKDNNGKGSASDVSWLSVRSLAHHVAVDTYPLKLSRARARNMPRLITIKYLT